MAKREHLHRGKRFGSGEWVYGNAVDIHDTDGGVCIVTDIKWATEEFIDCIYNSKVIPESVGEFTGLTDKNGVKIFEGDIVIFNRKRNLPNYKSIPEVIKFHQGDCAFQRYPYGQAFVKSGAGRLLQPDMMSECEVIGNIHDNPELIGGEENGKTGTLVQGEKS